MRRLRALIMVTFGFSRSEARAFVILLPLISIIVFIEPIYQAWYLSGKPNHFDDAKKLDSLIATWTWNENHDTAKVVSTPRLFRFNPNTVSVSAMDSMGIPPSVSRRIDKYRVKGGKFKVRSDFSKMYGLDSALYVRLEPFITLPASLPRKETSLPPSSSFVKRQAATTPAHFDLNLADTTTLNSVYGIGPALARRIVAYRERLGGFIQAEQLYEVWGLDSAVVERTLAISEVSHSFVPKTININETTEQELASHPYMKPKTARLIVTYRFQHGKFASFGDLEKINLIDTKTFNRIRPYLTLE